MLAETAQFQPPTRSTWLAVIAVSSAALTGCLEELPDPALIDDLRVLAIRAEPPEVEPGATVSLDALVVDPLGRPRTYAWYACLVADQTRGFFGGGSETSTSGGRGNSLSDDQYGGSCALRYEAGERWAFKLGEGATASFTVPADLFETQDALKAAYGLPTDLVIPAEIETGFLGIAGINYRVSLVVEVDGRRIESDKRVNVSRDLGLPNNRPNQNPEAPNVHIALTASKTSAPATTEAPPAGRCFVGAPIPLGANQVFTLTPVNLPDPSPTYLVLLAGTSTDTPFEIVEKQETLFFSFFSTGGSFGKDVSKTPGDPPNEWRLVDSRPAPTDTWIVARDGRGGVSWCHEPHSTASEGPATP